MLHKIRQIMHRHRLTACTAAAVVALVAYAASCSNIDCPLNNKVELACGFYNSETNGSTTIGDTITITAAGTDSILFNYGYNISSLDLPMSYMREVDTFVVKIMGLEASSVDTIFVSHTNEPHFESVDCGMTLFHEIKGVEWTSNGNAAGLSRIDSVAVANPKVNYDETENIKIYFTLP